MKIADLKPGDVVVVDGGMTCMIQGRATVEADSEGDLFVHCRQGFHYLDGQQGDGGELIGLSWPQAVSS